MPLPMQAKLLRVLEEGEVERIGGDKTTAVDVRVLVATHRNLEELVKEGKFRQDLLHRVYVFPITLPPLRERREDIPALIEHFARQVAAQNNWKPIAFSPEAIEALQLYAWPGNVRELRNVVERVIAIGCGRSRRSRRGGDGHPRLAEASGDLNSCRWVGPALRSRIRF